MSNLQQPFWLFCCPKCGTTWLTANSGEILTCQNCNAIITKTDFHIEIVEEYLALRSRNNKSYQPGAWDTIVKDAREQYCLHSPQFSQAAWDAREAKEQRDADIASGKVKLPPSPPAPKPRPKCPTCGSTNVRRIDGLERAGSILAVGIFSRKINKSFKCKDCGMTF